MLDGGFDLVGGLASQLATHGVLPVVFERFGHGLGVEGRAIELLAVEEVQDAGHKLAVEVGALLLAGVTHNVRHLRKFEYILPKLHEAVFPFVAHKLGMCLANVTETLFDVDVKDIACRTDVARV